MAKKVKKKRSNMVWTSEEDEILMNKWGKMKLENLSKKLCRSVKSIEHRAIFLGLGGMYETGDFLLSSDIAKIMGVHRSTVSNWTSKFGLKHEKICFKSQPRIKITYEDFFKWLEENQHRWDSRDMDTYIFEKEPSWLQEKIKSDNQKRKRGKLLTPYEVNEVVNMYKKGMKIGDIAKEFKVGRDVINHKIIELRNKGENIPYKKPRKSKKVLQDNLQ